MDSTGEIISFRVNFTKTQNIPESEMRLTFFGNIIPYSLNEEYNLLLNLEKNIENSPSGFILSEITEILPNSDQFNAGRFSKFSVMLYEKKDSLNPDLKKRGLLIGYSKDKEVFIIGVWPYAYFQKSGGNLQRIGKEFFANSENFEIFSHFLHISQK